jgi:GNAT superfamily N-acetyltransferase
LRLVRYADRPDLRERRYEELVRSTFPEYLDHNEPGRNWGRLYTDFSDFQVALVDGAELLAEAHAIPIYWDGTIDGLPSGWDEGFESGMSPRRSPTTLMAVAISVAPSHQGRKLSSRMIESLTDNARAAGLGSVIAPVRPTSKSRYPLVPIERYVEWRRDDGAHFDPWIRIHERVSGEILAPAPRSMVIRAPASEWEEWIGMRFPEDGDYVFPEALAVLEVREGVGTHVEPNVWMRHAV